VKQFLRALILALLRLLGMRGARRAARATREPFSQAPRILLVRPDHLGDLVLTTPILDALRSNLADAHITMMVGPWSSEVVARHPALDRLIPCPFPGFQRAPQKALSPYLLLWQTARHLRRHKYDLAINLRPDFWWGAALLYLARIPRRIGYSIEPGTPFLTAAMPFQPPEHATLSNLRLASAALEALGRAPLPQPFSPALYPLRFTPDPQELAWVAERLCREGISQDTSIVVIHPGSGAAVKLWRNEAWSVCANSLPGLLTGAPLPRIILTGSQRERPMLAGIASGMTAAPVLLTDTSTGQLAALLQRAKLVMGVDSGPLHLAVAQGTPTLQIFGPTDSRIFGPWGMPEWHVVIAATQACPGCPGIPCGRLDFRTEELPAHPCVRLVAEQQVEAAAAAILRKDFAASPHPE
jgi:ADP-heptose:LPS heptosyltransferase